MREDDKGIANEGSEKLFPFWVLKEWKMSQIPVWKCSYVSDFIWIYADVNEISIWSIKKEILFSLFCDRNNSIPDKTQSMCINEATI